MVDITCDLAQGPGLLPDIDWIPQGNDKVDIRRLVIIGVERFLALIYAKQPLSITRL